MRLSSPLHPRVKRNGEEGGGYWVGLWGGAAYGWDEVWERAGAIAPDASGSALIAPPLIPCPPALRGRLPPPSTGLWLPPRPAAPLLVVARWAGGCAPRCLLVPHFVTPAPVF